MLVSGGQILAIDQVNTGKTILGDGVQKPLDVNTDLIATNSAVSSVSSKLEQSIDYVSGHLPAVTAGKNVGVEVSATPDGRPLYIVSADDVEQREIHIIGNNGVSAVFNDATSSWNIGVSAQYLSANALNNYYNKQQVDNKLTATSSWANNTFQKKGDYVSATDFNQFKTDVNTALDKKQDVSAMTAYAQSAWVNDNYQKKGNYVSATDFDNYKTQVSQEFTNTSAWANETFQEKGEYVSAAEFNEYKEKVAQEFENTSAWANDTFQEKGEYVSASEFNEYKEQVETEFENTSAWANNTFQLSGDYVSASDFNEYKEQVATEFTNTSAWANETFQPVGEYVSATEFNEYKTEVSQEFTNTSAWANETFQPVGEYISASEKFLSANALDEISGKWESVYDTTVTASGNWNEASAFGAASSKFVTSSDTTFDDDLAYFLKKQEDDGVAWEGVDLSNLGKMYPISSLTPDLVSATISAVEGGSAYVISAAEPGEVAAPGISGENGVSAHYDAEENTYVIGLSGSPAYASFTATMTANEDDEYVPATYSEAYNVGEGVTLDGTTLTVGPGLWHVTIYAKVTNTETSPDYYDTVLTCNSIKNVVQFDNSYIHSEYVNLDADFVSNGDLTINTKLEDVPEDSVVTIEQLQLHKIVTGNVNNAGSSTYTQGEGITIDNYQINVNAGSGLAINEDDNTVDVQAGSGVYVDANNKLSIKLGKGLAFSADGDIVAIETDTEVNDVVETVETLKKELDGKLTTNMNVSDAKTEGNAWNGGGGNANHLAAAFFTVPLQHNLTTASEISFFTTQKLGENDTDSFPLIVGILEYNFDYIETANNAAGVSARSQTQWIADTGPIWIDTPDVQGHYLSATTGRFTYELKNLTPTVTNEVTGEGGTIYINEYGPTLRSDRAYYLVMYAYHTTNYHMMCDDGYASSINNSDPAISFRHEQTPYVLAPGNSATINTAFLTSAHDNNIPLSISAMGYWDRQLNSVNQIQRPYVMIRNPRL